MKKRMSVILFALIFIGITATGARAATIDLYDWAFNIDGSVIGGIETYDPFGYYVPAPGDLPAYIDDTSFDWYTGLGTITIDITGAGVHSVYSFFDHEIDEFDNSYYNEIGGAFNGAPAVGQTWEIDEPGWVDGDIYENLLAANLDNGVGTSIYGDTFFPDDVSMAMGWDFSLADGETATVSLVLSDTATPGGFYLLHSDFDSDPGTNPTIYFSSSLERTVKRVPEPSTLLLLGSGLAGLGLVRRKLMV